MGMNATIKDFLKEGTESCQDNLMRLNLFTILTHQGDISELVALPESSERGTDAFLKIIPLQTELLICHGQDLIECNALKLCMRIAWYRMVTEQIRYISKWNSNFHLEGHFRTNSLKEGKLIYANESAKVVYKEKSFLNINS